MFHGHLFTFKSILICLAFLHSEVALSRVRDRLADRHRIIGNSSLHLMQPETDHKAIQNLCLVAFYNAGHQTEQVGAQTELSNRRKLSHRLGFSSADVSCLQPHRKHGHALPGLWPQKSLDSAYKATVLAIKTLQCG